jgi:hypothetical protein
MEITAVICKRKIQPIVRTLNSKIFSAINYTGRGSFIELNAAQAGKKGF